jgi:SAM-dependent methyltransferase
MRDLCRDALLGYLEYIYRDTVAKKLEAQKDCLEWDPAATYLDCGCRAGRKTAKLAELVGTQTVLGSDLNLRVLREAKKRGLSAVRMDFNCSLPLQSNSVDVITALDVLEHLLETYTFVAELYRVLVPGGYMVIATPNLASWHNIFALLLGLQPFSGPNITSMRDADLDIVRRMHRRDHGLSKEGEYVDTGERELDRHIVVVACKSLVKLLRQTGFIVESVRGFGYDPLPPMLSGLFCRLDVRHAHHLVIRARKPFDS